MSERSKLLSLTALAALATMGAGAACEGVDGDDAACATPGTICTWAGTGQRSFNGDGRGRRDSSFYWPMDIDFAPDGRAYILDWQNHRVRRAGVDGRIETVVGTPLPGDGPPDQSDLRPEGALGTTVELNHPTDVALLPDGAVLIAAWHNHKIRRLDPRTGRVHVICGSEPGHGGDGAPAASALLGQPKSVATDAAGAVYVTDSRNQRIRKIESADPAARIVTVAGSGRKGPEGDGGVPKDAAFHMQQVDENPEPGGGIALDAQGRLYLADTFNHRVRRIDLGAGTVTTVAGNGAPGSGGDGGPAVLAGLAAPRDIEIGPDGKLVIADTDNHRIRVVDLATGIIETVAGDGVRAFAGDSGPAAAAQLDRPFGVAFDGAGNLYIADTFNDRIRKVTR